MFAAYTKYASSLNLKCDILDSDAGRISAKISGEGAFKAFKNESGRHVVQRLSAGRHHTSVVSVAILSVKKEVNNKLLEKDLVIATMRGTGPGGQRKNRRETCVRITHIPTGLQAVVDERDQQTSKRKALEILTDRVLEHQQNQNNSNYNISQKEQLGNGGRGGNKIRTYNFIKSFVKNHANGKETKNIKGVLEKGEFDLIK